MTPTARTTSAGVVLFCCSVLLVACTSDESQQCATGEKICGTACVRLDSSAQNCGACGNTCSGDQFCSAGVCTSCPEGLTICGDGPTAECIDVTSDPANCGGCGTACQASYACIEGQCRCPFGFTLCGERCVWLNDPDNCGACGNVCAPPLSCVSGSCRCEPGSSVCGDQCVPMKSSDNCGACGDFCPEGYTCEGNYSYGRACKADGSLIEQPPEFLDFTFGAARPVATVLADLDGDAVRDLLVLTDSRPGRFILVTPQLHWLRGTGGGRFEAPVLLWEADDERLEGQPVQVSIARLRPRPAAPQVLLSSRFDCILFADGVPATTPPMTFYGRCLAFDADGDGVDELATEMGIAHLGEDGSLSKFVRPTGWGPPYLAADFNADGRLDVLSDRMLYSRGDGTFERGMFPVFDHSHYQRLAVELDGDGQTDVILVGENVTSAFRKTASKFELAHEWTTRGLLAAGDLDGDGLDELVSGAYLLLNNAGRFSAWVEAPWNDIGIGADLQDTDGDGRLEVLVLMQAGLRIFLPQPSSSTWPLP